MAGLDAAAGDDRASAVSAALHGGRTRQSDGARALYIGETVYRLHGTNQPQTIGSAVSSGCFRLVNNDIIDLYERVPVGTKIIVKHAPRLEPARRGRDFQRMESNDGRYFGAVRRACRPARLALHRRGRPGRTLDPVKQRARSICGVSEGLSSFSPPSAKGLEGL